MIRYWVSRKSSSHEIIFETSDKWNDSQKVVIDDLCKPLREYEFTRETVQNYMV